MMNTEDMNMDYEGVEAPDYYGEVNYCIAVCAMKRKRHICQREKNGWVGEHIRVCAFVEELRTND